MSTSFPDRLEPESKVIRQPVREQWHAAAIPSIEPSASPPPAIPSRSPQKTKAKKRIDRQLTPAKLGVAWDKVRCVIKNLCRQRGADCVFCKPYGNRIEFQLTHEYQPISLDLEGDRIIARIGHKRWMVRMVRIKTGGSGYELRRSIRTATWLLIELLNEARR